jgi:phage terminase large subunit
LSKNLSNDEIVICDSSEPKSIKDYSDKGVWARGAEKPPGSVSVSMKWLASLTAVIIDPARCPNTLQEFRDYEYEKTKDGEIISGYPDKNNHFIDAVRYATNLLWVRRETPRKGFDLS